MEREIADFIRHRLCNSSDYQQRDWSDGKEDENRHSVVKIYLHGTEEIEMWTRFRINVADHELERLVVECEDYENCRDFSFDGMMGVMKLYAQIHKIKHAGHKVRIYGNYVECETCGDHAHYDGGARMRHHNSDYSLNEVVDFEKVA